LFRPWGTHPDREKKKEEEEDAYILTCTVSLEYEKTEVNSFFIRVQKRNL